MKTSWEKHSGRRTDYLDIHYNEVVIGNHYGTGMSDNAGACSHNEFLAGRFQDLILEIFGQDILKEAIKIVKLAKKGKIPEFQRKKEEVLEHKFFLETIPIDKSLKDLQDKKKHPETIHGFDYYGNEGTYKTKIKSDNLTFFADSQKGYLEDKNGNRKHFKLRGHCSGVVELHDYFYVINGDNFTVISPDAEIIFDTTTIKFDKYTYMFGDYVRINRVFRYKDTIFFHYWFFNNAYPSGLIKYELKKGFASRWEIID